MDSNAMETVLQLAETINGRQHAGLRIDAEDWSALYQACAKARADADKLAQREAASREVVAAAKALLANWARNLTPYAQRLQDALNILDIEPTPRVEHTAPTDLRSALQWLLDDMHDAGETHGTNGVIFDSVENAAKALIEAGGGLFWYPPR